MEALIRDRLALIYRQLGWEPATGEDPLRRQLRGQVLTALGTIGNDPQVQETARSYHARFAADAASVDPEVAAASVTIVAHAGDEQVYADFFQRFQSAQNPQDERRYLYALTAFREASLLQQTLAHSLDGTIRTQDAPFVAGMLFYNTSGNELAWRFMTAHWDEMLERFPDNAIIRMVEGVSALSTPALAGEVEAFFRTHEVPDAGKRLDQTLERLRINVDFRGRESGKLDAYLANSADSANPASQATRASRPLTTP